VLVHRPKYDDWSLPKGKAHDDEPDEETALREVLEETGLRCRLRFELPSTEYVDSRGRPKRVRYWAMEPLGGAFEPHDEVDELRWLSPAQALGLLTWERDQAVVRAFGHMGERRLLLVRHGSAGERDAWEGDDRERPLDERGLRQAERLAEVLEGHEVLRLVSSPFLRCVQTVEPLAAARSVELERDERLADGAGAAGVAAVLRELGAGVLCLHGAELEQLLGRRPAKGSVTLVDRDLRAVAEIPPPA
jgi:8-oxo-(d)GTP phosphatase